MIQLFAPLVTPFLPNESIDLDAMLGNLERYENTPLDGYLINGSSAEAEMMSQKERDQILVEICGATQRKVLAGVIATSTREALEQIDRFAEYGLELEAVMVRTPGFFGAQLDQVAFFLEVASASPFPVFLYQIPQLTGIKLSGPEMVLISAHPNIAGIKDSAGDLTLLNEVEWPIGFRYYLGASSLLQPGLAAGAAGGILALANVVPELCRKVLEASADPARQVEARALQRRLIPLNYLVGGSRGFGIAGLKAACDLQGYCGGAPRRPLKPLGAHEKEQLSAALFALLDNSDESKST